MIIMKNLMKESQAYYQDNDYYEMFSIAEDYPNKIKMYFKNNIKGDTILDAGCGTGKFTKTLEELSKKYIGVDLSNNQLTKAKSKSIKPNSEFIQANLANIPLKDNSVDIIVSTWVLGTIKDLEERNKCIQELKRVLKPNGKIFLVENDLLGEFEIIREKDKTNATKIYNDYLLNCNFKEQVKLQTYFKFPGVNSAKNCFNVIYGKKISNKITNDIINHNIVIFKYIN